MSRLAQVTSVIATLSRLLGRSWFMLFMLNLTGLIQNLQVRIFNTCEANWAGVAGSTGLSCRFNVFRGVANVALQAGLLHVKAFFPIRHDVTGRYGKVWELIVLNPKYELLVLYIAAKRRRRQFPQGINTFRVTACHQYVTHPDFRISPWTQVLVVAFNNQNPHARFIV